MASSDLVTSRPNRRTRRRRRSHAEINAKVDAANEEQGKGWLGGLFGGDKDSSTPQKKTTEPIATTGAPDEPTGKAEAAKPESVQML